MRPSCGRTRASRGSPRRARRRGRSRSSREAGRGRRSAARGRRRSAARRPLRARPREAPGDSAFRAAVGRPSEGAALMRPTGDSRPERPRGASATTSGRRSGEFAWGTPESVVARPRRRCTNARAEYTLALPTFPALRIQLRVAPQTPDGRDAVRRAAPDWLWGNASKRRFCGLVTRASVHSSPLSRKRCSCSVGPCSRSR